jgi:hypothetical protein
MGHLLSGFVGFVEPELKNSMYFCYPNPREKSTNNLKADHYFFGVTLANKFT